MVVTSEQELSIMIDTIHELRYVLALFQKYILPFPCFTCVCTHQVTFTFTFACQNIVYPVYVCPVNFLSVPMTNDAWTK